jgi:hypothetical protein
MGTCRHLVKLVINQACTMLRYADNRNYVHRRYVQYKTRLKCRLRCCSLLEGRRGPPVRTLRGMHSDRL